MARCEAVIGQHFLSLPCANRRKGVVDAILAPSPDDTFLQQSRPRAAALKSPWPPGRLRQRAWWPSSSIAIAAGGLCAPAERSRGTARAGPRGISLISYPGLRSRCLHGDPHRRQPACLRSSTPILSRKRAIRSHAGPRRLSRSTAPLMLQKEVASPRGRRRTGRRDDYGPPAGDPRLRAGRIPG